MSFIEIPEPGFKQGDFVKVYETGETFTVWVRMYDIDLKEWFYEDAEHNYNYYANELALVHTNPEPDETIQIPKPKYGLYTLLKEDVSEDEEWGSVIDITYNPQKGGWFYTVQYGANRKYPTGYTTIFPEHILKSWQEYKDND